MEALKRSSPGAAQRFNASTFQPFTPSCSPAPRHAGSVFRRFLFPLGIDLGFELAAADQFLQVADDGAAGHAELAGEGGDVGALAGLADDLQDAVLAAEAVGRAAEEIEGVNAVGAFEGLELADGLVLAAFLEGGLDGAFGGRGCPRAW